MRFVSVFIVFVYLDYSVGDVRTGLESKSTNSFSAWVGEVVFSPSLLGAFLVIRLIVGSTGIVFKNRHSKIG